MLHINKRQPLNYRILTWVRHIQNVAGFNSFVGDNPPLTWDRSILELSHLLITASARPINNGKYTAILNYSLLSNFKVI